MSDDTIVKHGDDLITLIRSLLLNENVKLNNPNYNAIYKLAKFHSLTNILYYSLSKYLKENNCSSEVDIDLLKQLSKDNKTELVKAATQESEKELLQEILEEKEINYMLLKGSVIKYYYPSYDMRSMADLDIYFDSTRHKEIKNIMKELGYNVESYLKGNHDSFMKVPFMNVEMHRDLMNECYEMSLYYKNFWPKLIKKYEDKHEYEFSKEDYYIFMIAHAAKHFSGGGTGIRSFIDIYLYLEKNELDFDYIINELNKMGLAKFEFNARNLAKLWFSNEEISKDNKDLLKEMSEFVINSGTYGTVSHSILNDIMGKDTVDNINSSKFRYLLRRLFPPYHTMINRNPILKKIPILLPLFWITRLFKGVFLRRDMIKSELGTVNTLEDDEVKKNKKIHEDIGV